MAEVCVRFYAGAARAAGCHEEAVRCADLAELQRVLCERHQVELPRVLAVATLLVDGARIHDSSAPLRDGAIVEVLPPFAGG